MNEKIIEKLTDQKFTNKLIGLKTKEEAKKVFKAEGIEITDKELDELGNQISLVVKEISKIPKEQLEKISGGLFGLGPKRLSFESLTFMDVDPLNSTNSTAFSDSATFSNAGSSGITPLVIGGVGAAATFATGAYLYLRKGKTPIKKTQPFVSKEALAGAAVAFAIVGGGYALSKLLKSSWFKEQ